MRFPIGSKVRITKPNWRKSEPDCEVEVVEVVWVILRHDYEIERESPIPVLVDRLKLIKPEAPEEGEG